MSLLDNLPHTATAKRRTRTKDTLAGAKDSFPITLFADRACWMQPLGASESTECQSRGITATHKVYFTADPGLDERCILVIQSITYDVKSVSSPDCSAGLGVLWRATCEKWRTPQ